MKKIIFSIICMVCLPGFASGQVSVNRKVVILGLEDRDRERRDFFSGLYFDFGAGFSVFSDTEYNPMSDEPGFRIYGGHFSFHPSLRYTVYETQYLGFDVLKINIHTGKGALDEYFPLSGTSNLNKRYHFLHYQLMPGIRGTTRFWHPWRYVAGYGALRVGAGGFREKFDSDILGKTLSGFGLCGELELGCHITRHFLIGVSVNYQGGKRNVKNIENGNIADAVRDYGMWTYSVRAGFTFAENK